MHKFITLEFGMKETEERYPDYNNENMIQFHTYSFDLPGDIVPELTL